MERTIPATRLETFNECDWNIILRFSRLLTIGKEDVTGVSMIAIRPKTNMDVSLLVKVKKADSVKNIKAKLFCGNADSPVHMVKMDGQKFVIFPSIPLDGAECHITVEASATQASHRVKTGEKSRNHSVKISPNVKAQGRCAAFKQVSKLRS